MAKFSQGFMDVLSRTGTPQAAMQQGQQEAPAYGSLQRNLGAAFGMDQRSRPEMASAAIDRLDPNSKDALIQSLAVQAKYEQDPQKKIVYMLEIDKINKESSKEKELKDIETQKDNRYGNMAKTVVGKSSELASLISQGDPEAYRIGLKMMTPPETLSPKDRYMQLGKRVFDVILGDFVGSLPDADTEYETKEIVNSEGETVIIWYDKSDPNKVVRTELKPKEDRQSVAAFKRGTELITESNRAQADASAALNLATEFDKINVKGGVYRDVEEFIKGVTGSQDKISSLYDQGRRLITSRAVANLPRGPASDKDVALVLRGEPPSNASGAYLAQYARGVSKLLRKEAEISRKNSYWLDKYGDEKGFSAYIRVPAVRQELSSLPADLLEEMEKNGSDPLIASDFELIYGYNYLEAKQELQEAERTLKDLGRTL
jgi:hypothetical protein